MDDFRIYLDKVFKVEPQNEEAQELLNKILERGGSIYDVKNYESIDTANQQLAEGQNYLQEEKLNEATLSFLDVIDKKSDSYAAYNGLGIIAYKRKMYNT